MLHVFIFLLFIAVIFPNSTLSHATNYNVDIATLAKHSYWYKLGHYKKKRTGGYYSLIRNNDFFLAKKGATNPKAELEVTYQKITEDILNQIEGDTSIRCRYPARFHWLNHKLNANWPEANCPELRQWQEVLNPEGLTLIVPTAFMNNPSSMFGHTLLRIDEKKQAFDITLASYGVNFAANPEQTNNTLFYSLKGLFGRYTGSFSLMPYYIKVREYNDIESRDIWEYALQLSPDELTRILEHLWEQKNTQFKYYFIDQNCSYQLLALLETAREDLDLTSTFHFSVIPSEVLKVLTKKNLIAAPIYRPASGTRLIHYANQLNKHQLNDAKLAMNHPVNFTDNYTPKQQAAILEMAYEWLNYQYYNQGLSRDKTALQLQNLLRNRSKISIKSPFSTINQPVDSPENGHGATRVGFGGVMGADNHFILDWRVNYHDLLDRREGYIDGAQINFLDSQIEIKDTKLSLKKLYLIDVISAAPNYQIFNSHAWNTRIGYDLQPYNTTQISNQTSDKSSYKAHYDQRAFFQSGYGRVWGNTDLIYGFMLGSAEANYLINRNTITVGTGVEAGILLSMKTSQKISITGQFIPQYPVTKNRTQAELSWHWATSKNTAIRTTTFYNKWCAKETQISIRGFIYY